MVFPVVGLTSPVPSITIGTVTVYFGFLRIPFGLELSSSASDLSEVVAFSFAFLSEYGVPTCDVGVSISIDRGDTSNRSLAAASTRFCSALGDDSWSSFGGSVTTVVEQSVDDVDVDDDDSSSSASSFLFNVVSIEISFWITDSSESMTGLIDIKTIVVVASAEDDSVSSVRLGIGVIIVVSSAMVSLYSFYHFLLMMD